MRCFTAVLAPVLVVTGSLAVVAQSGHESAPGGAGLPASLEALYPPASPTPVFLLGMHAVNGPLAGLVVDLHEGDREGMGSNYERFATEYRELSALVPEWRDRYASEPVEALGAAVRSGRPDSVMPAVERVAAVCHACHLATMVPVQQRYGWPDFASVAASDPSTGRTVGYATLMQMLNTSLSGIAVSLEQEQPDNAREQWRTFASLFGGMRDSCATCHDTERRHYVDPGIQEQVDRLGEALRRAPIDRGAVAELSRRIGAGSCTPCHKVHLPAAYAAVSQR